MAFALKTAIEQLIDKLTDLTPSNDGTRPTVVQLTAECQPTGFSLPSFLSCQSEPCKMLWQSRDSQRQVAALGVLHEHRIDPQKSLEQQLSDCQQWLCNAVGDPSIFGGIAFNPSRSQWCSFSAGRFVLPRIELIKSSNGYTLCCNVDRSKNPTHFAQQVTQTRQLLSSLNTSPPLLTRVLPRLELGEFTPTYSEWERKVDAALAAFEQGEMQKVVLSRQGTLLYRDTFNPWQLIQSWRQAIPSSYHFAFQFSENDCFLGCSPERLYQRSGSQLTTEALAGTTLRSGDQKRDQAMAEALLNDPKNRHENALVSQEILRRLSPLCDSLGPSGDLSVIQLRALQHLKIGLQGTIKPTVSDGALLAALHPTPAVGGTPRATALSFIQQQEPYDRGWYAGAVGRLARSETDFCVAIRSARIQDRQVQVFSGAGIVPGSDPMQEWQELGNKLSTVFSLLLQ